jgi:hypothetical protein
MPARVRGDKEREKLHNAILRRIVADVKPEASPKVCAAWLSFRKTSPKALCSNANRDAFLNESWRNTYARLSARFFGSLRNNASVAWRW